MHVCSQHKVQTVIDEIFGGNRNTYDTRTRALSSILLNARHNMGFNETS
jgi:hypothetical protein